jgi:hypothetical protein
VRKINNILNYLVNDVCNSEGSAGVKNMNFMSSLSSWIELSSEYWRV